MEFTLEHLDMEQIKDVYLLRGYENPGDDNYCLNMTLVQGLDDSFAIKLFLSKKTLTIKDGKEFFKYMRKAGMKVTAEVLKADFDRFYSKRGFQRILENEQKV